MVLALTGLLLTTIWLMVGVWYVAESIGLENFLLFLPSEIGQFLTGFLLPLALLWLILGYLHFAKRLRRVEDALWQVAALRRPRGNGGGPQSSGPEDWLDESRGSAAGSSAAPARAGAGQPDAPDLGASGQGQEHSKDGPPPRSGGLATELFTSRMRDRMAARHEPPATAATAGQARSTAPAQRPWPGRPLPSDYAKPPAQAPVKARERSVPPRAAADAGAGPQAVPAAPPRMTPPSAVPAAAPPAAASSAAPNVPPPVAPQPAAAAHPETDVNRPAEPQPAASVSSGAAEVEASVPAPCPATAPDPATEERKEETSKASPCAPAEPRPIGFRHLVRITSMELNSLAMDLAGILCRDNEHAQALKGYDKGEKDVFFQLLCTHLGKEKPAEAAKRLNKRKGGDLADAYLRKFAALTEEARGVDRSGALMKSLEAMPIGRLIDTFQALQAVKAKR